MNVYLIEGYRCWEGGFFHSLYSTKDEAKTVAKALVNNDECYDKILVFEVPVPCTDNKNRNLICSLSRG